MPCPSCGTALQTRVTTMAIGTLFPLDNLETVLKLGGVDDWGWRETATETVSRDTHARSVDSRSRKTPFDYTSSTKTSKISYRKT